MDAGLGDMIVCAGLLAFLAQRYTIILRYSAKQAKNRVTHESFFAGTGIKLVHSDWKLPFTENPYCIEQSGRKVNSKIEGKLSDPFYSLFSFCFISQEKKNKVIYPYPIGFYKKWKVPYSLRFRYCPLRNNSFRVDQLPVPDEPYIFMHEDLVRGFPIDKRRIPKGVKIIQTKHDETVSVLAYRDLIENAKEIHCIDSSFFHLVNSFRPIGKLVYHYYARPRSPEFDMHREWVKLV